MTNYYFIKNFFFSINERISQMVKATPILYPGRRSIKKLYLFVYGIRIWNDLQNFSKQCHFVMMLRHESVEYLFILFDVSYTEISHCNFWQRFFFKPSFEFWLRGIFLNHIIWLQLSNIDNFSEILYQNSLPF